jgi:plasmid stabilization system protein ParE
MGLEIYWTEFAERELENIFEYYLEHASPEIAEKITSGILNSTDKLKENPEIGPIEQRLKNRPQGFRFINYKRYKIIYWINKDENRVEINDVFNTRQDPVEMERNE